MFKKCFSTVACLNATFEQVINLALHHQMDGVEFRMDNDGGICGISGISELHHYSNMMKDKSIKVVDIGTSVCFCDYSESEIEKCYQAVCVAEALGAPAIRIFLGNFAQRKDSVRKLLDYQGVILACQAVCDYGAEHGIEIWIETHNEFSTGKVLSQLLNQINRDNIKVIWDIMHPIEAGEDIEETWEELHDRIAHVHIKDGFKRADPMWNDYQYSALGRGSLPIFSLLDLLRDVGYTGFISLEWEMAWRKELAEYGEDINGVLDAFNEYLKLYETNTLQGFASGWTLFDSASQQETNDIVVSNHCAELILTVDQENPAMKKYNFKMSIKPNESYRVVVPFKLIDCNRQLAPFAMISLFGEDNLCKRKLYFLQQCNGKMELEFTSESETCMILELGVKAAGTVKWYHPSISKIDRPIGNKLRVGAVHISVIDNIEYQTNLRRIADAFDRAAVYAPDLLTFSETINDRGTILSLEEKFETIEGPFCTLMKCKAKEHKCYVFFSFHELDENGVRHNTAILLNRNGEISGVYRKSHLSWKEYESGMVPGDSYPVFDTEFGKIGMLICWDAYFPDPAKVMALQGAKILLVSTAGNPTFRHIARAMENGVFVVVSGAAAFMEAGGIKATKIISPRGEILAQTSEDQSCALAEIDLGNGNYISWLSVGPPNTIPNTIYRNEARDDLMFFPNYNEVSSQ